ncbi:MAG: HAD family hydrolase [bacterium]
MQLDNRISAIIFDCDGVLVDSEVLGLADTVVFLQENGFSWTAADVIRRLTGQRLDGVLKTLKAEYHSILGREPDATELDEIYQGLLQCRRANRHKLQIVPGADKMGASLEALSFIIGVASSSQAHFLQSKLQRLGLWGYFAPHIYSADAVGIGKPAPDIFLYTAEKLNIPPRQCLVIEDSAAGVRAALAAGMDVWGFIGAGHCFEGHGRHLQQAGARRIICSHEELIDALFALDQSTFIG